MNSKNRIRGFFLLLVFFTALTAVPASVGDYWSVVRQIEADNPDIEIHTNYEKWIINIYQKSGPKNPAGDTFYKYIKLDENIWLKQKLTHLGNGRYAPPENIDMISSNEDVPFYSRGIYAIYYDDDGGELSVAAQFRTDADDREKIEWIGRVVREFRQKLSRP